ncbi:MAG TPA: hypothetical protein VMV87_18200 [Burkholderiales bacterium]|nr:hypothetical protein [Burkholderiales bacterium]
MDDTLRKDAKDLPAYLSDDASYLQCSKCGRKSWSEKVNADCRMPQPGGAKCSGILEGRNDLP